MPQHVLGGNRLIADGHDGCHIHQGKKNGLACYSLEVLFNIKGELMCFE